MVHTSYTGRTFRFRTPYATFTAKVAGTFWYDDIPTSVLVYLDRSPLTVSVDKIIEEIR